MWPLPVQRGNISNGQFAILGRVDHHRGCRWAQSRARLSHGWCDQPVPVAALEGGIGAGAGTRRSGHCGSVRVRRPAGNGGANFGRVTGKSRGSANGSSTVPSASAVVHGHETRRSIRGKERPHRCDAARSG